MSCRSEKFKLILSSNFFVKTQRVKMDSKTILELRPLLKTFFPVAWLGHLGLGLTYGLMGPAQPYLAR